MNNIIAEIYNSSYNDEMNKLGGSLGNLSKELSKSPVANFFKKRSLKKAIDSAIKRSDIKLSVLKQEGSSPEISKKIFTALKTRNKRLEAMSSI